MREIALDGLANPIPTMKPGLADLDGNDRSAPLPQPQYGDEWRSNPQDLDFPGLLRLEIDATDTVRGIVRGEITIPVAEGGPITLLYPKWMPGYRSPENPLELFAGLKVEAGQTVLDWRRDPVEVYAFHLDVPEGTRALKSATSSFRQPARTRAMSSSRATS